jgi:hypothetical protein
MIDDDEYRTLGDDPAKRVGVLLGQLETGWRNAPEKLSDEAKEFTHKFVCKVETIFASLPKPTKWRSLVARSPALKEH